MAEYQIKCINKQDRPNPWERITHVGGAGWKLTQPEAIAHIEARLHSFFVRKSGIRVDVIVRESRFGNKYLTTEADGETQNNFLSLPECP